MTVTDAILHRFPGLLGSRGKWASHHQWFVHQGYALNLVMMSGKDSPTPQRGCSSYADNHTHNKEPWNVLTVVKEEFRVLGRVMTVGLTWPRLTWEGRDGGDLKVQGGWQWRKGSRRAGAGEVT